MGENGAISNSEKFKKLEGTDGLFEFKSFQVRIICFMTSNKKVVLCHGVIKKKDKHAKSDLNIAARFKNKYESRG
jgi:phage-related protein